MNLVVDPRTPIGETRYNRASDELRTDIVNGQFADGDRLITTDLAKRYGLSLAPIREALHQLAAEGIVIIQPMRGAVVRAVTPAFLEEIYEIRLALIPQLESVRAGLATDTDVLRMERAEEAYEASVAAGSREGPIEFNVAFHRAALAVRPNREAVETLERHNKLIRALRIRWGYRPGRYQMVMAEHRGLIDAYRQRSPDRAREISRTHLLNAYKELQKLCF